MRCLDLFHLNAFAQIEMSAYSLESNSSTAANCRLFSVPGLKNCKSTYYSTIQVFNLCRLTKTTTFTQAHYTANSLLAFLNSEGYGNRF